MSPAKNGPAAMRRGFLCISVVAALTATGGAGEDRTPGQPNADKTASPSKTSSPNEKAPAQKGRSATTSGPVAAGADESPSRLAASEKGTTTRVARKPTGTTMPEAPVQRAIRIVADCQDRYQSVSDYTCTFFKRERISGQLIPAHIMAMKVRTKPHSVYLKFEQPAKGREAIYIAGRHGGKVLAHDVGFNKFLAGTLALEPTSSRAMDSCRHPITEAGIGPLLETVAKRWAVELDPNETIVTFANMRVGEQHCSMIETTHPQKSEEFLFYRVRLYIDKEMGLPVRFEAYDWPKHKGAEPELAEEYTYSNLKLNVGLSDRDFDVNNGSYSFGRF
jgi:outer membrane lipoprotein-sorting protein